MKENNSGLAELVITAAGIAVTLFLLNRYLNNKKNDQQDLSLIPCTRTGRGYIDSVKINNIQNNNCEKEECLFPDEILVDYSRDYQQSWGELNPDAPDYQNNTNY